MPRYIYRYIYINCDSFKEQKCSRRTNHQLQLYHIAMVNENLLIMVLDRYGKLDKKLVKFKTAKFLKVSDPGTEAVKIQIDPQEAR